MYELKHLVVRSTLTDFDEPGREMTFGVVAAFQMSLNLRPAADHDSVQARLMRRY